MQFSSKHLLGTLAAALLLSLPATAQKRSIQPYLPESTAMVLSFPDFNASLRELKQMPLAKMWGEDELQDFVADLLKMADDAWGEGMEQARGAHEMGMLPIDPDQLTKLRVEGVTVAVTTLDLAMGQFGPIPKVGIMIQLEFGDSAPIWNQIIEMGLAMAEQMAPVGTFAVEKSEIGDFPLTTLIPLGPDAQAMSLNVAMLGTGIVIGTLKDEVVSTLERMNRGEPALADSDMYRAAFQHIDRDGAEAEAYLRVEPLVDFGLKALGFAAQMAPDFPDIDVAGVGRALNALGLNGVQAMGMASTYRGDTCVTTCYTVSPKDSRRGLFAGSDTDLNLDFLPWVPKDAVSFSANTCNFTGIYDGIVKALQAYDAELAEMALGHVAAMEAQLGFNVRNDLFGIFGNQFITWSMPMGGAIAAAPEMAILVEVKDPEGLVKILGVISQLSEGAFEIDEVERRGITAHQIRFNMDPTGGMAMNPLAMYIPTFSFKDGYMVMGFSAGDVKRVFDRMDREPEPRGDIRGNEEFAPYLQSIPREGLKSLSFTDWKANFEGIYQMLTALLAFVPVTDQIPVDFALLPDSSTLTQHLSGGISHGVADENGFLSTSRSPFGPEIMAIACGAGALATFLYFRIQ
jgi:hypothetical protein